MGIFGIDLNHMTALLSSVIIGVGVDFYSLHIRLLKNLINKYDKNKIGLRTSKDVGYPILLDVFQIWVLITDDEGIPNYNNYLKVYKLQSFLK